MGEIVTIPTNRKLIVPAGKARGARLWQPFDLPTGKELWYDVHDYSTITESGGSTSLIEDKFGNGVSLDQESLSAQPTYLATGLNGKPTLRLDGNDVLDTIEESNTLRNVSKGAAFIVVSYGGFGPTNNTPIFISTNQTTAMSRLLLTPNSAPTTQKMSIGGRRLDSQGFVSVESSTSTLIDTSVIQCGFLDYENGRAYHYTNGVEDANSTFQNTGSTSDTTSLKVSIGGGPGFVSNGTLISEVIVVSCDLTDDVRQKIEGYLAWKWLMVGSLDVGHPYKNNPPTVYV